MAEDKNETHYFLDGNPDELERLNLGQTVIKKCMGKLVLAPINLSRPGLCILDSATANGIWLQDLRAELPADVHDSSEFFGTDVTGIYFPRPQPEGVTLLEQSMTKPWPSDWNARFDFVHQRMALPAAPKDAVRDVLRAFVDLMKPGGWLQLVEPDHSVFEGPVMGDFYRLLGEIFAFMGTGIDYAHQLKGWLTELGLEDIEERIFDVPVGAKNADPEMAQKSTRMQQLVIKGLAEVAGSIPTSFTKEQLSSFPDRLRNECIEKGGVFRLHCVWGRKPLNT